MLMRTFRQEFILFSVLNSISICYLPNILFLFILNNYFLSINFILLKTPLVYFQRMNRINLKKKKYLAGIFLTYKSLQLRKRNNRNIVFENFNECIFHPKILGFFHKTFNIVYFFFLFAKHQKIKSFVRCSIVSLFSNPFPYPIY